MKKKEKIKFGAFLALLLVPATLMAQVAINTDGTNPHASAMLDVKSTTAGMLVPRMKSSERLAISSPADGLLVYDTDNESFWFFHGDTQLWTEIRGTMYVNQITDMDGDTKIQTEETADEDVIRFDVAGTEFFTMDQGRLSVRNTGQSVFVGEKAGENDDLSANNNVFIGFQAGQDNVSGIRNTASGYRVLESNTSGDYNTATGSYALHSNLDGGNNTGTGSFALYRNTSGDYNTALGRLAMYYNTEGSFNTATGYFSLRYNATGNNNTAIGRESMHSNSSGSSNTAIGVAALFSNTEKSNLIAIGDSALYNNGIGAESWEAKDNVAIGSKAMYTNTKGYANTAVGCNALYSDQTGSYNTATGFQALYSNQTGSNNTAYGSLALYSNESGRWNTASGRQALSDNTNGDDNSAFGTNALKSNSSGDRNTAMGAYSLYGNETGNSNVAIGTSALFSGTGTSNIVAIGDSALYYCNALCNTAIGSKALYSDVNGHSNTAIGYRALQLCTGNYNLAIGSGAGDNILTGNRNIIIGSNIDAPVANSSYQMSIGNMIFGNNIDGTGTTISSGNVGIGTNNPVAKLDVNGGVKIGNTTSCGSQHEGTVRYHDSQLDYCDGDGWRLLSRKVIIWSGGCTSDGSNNNWNIYCNDTVDFNTASSYFTADGNGNFTFLHDGFYRINFYTYGVEFEDYLVLYPETQFLINGVTFSLFHNRATAEDNHSHTNSTLDQIWYFEAGDVLRIEVLNTSIKAFYSYKADGSHGRIQLSYVGD